MSLTGFFRIPPSLKRWRGINFPVANRVIPMQAGMTKIFALLTVAFGNLSEQDRIPTNTKRAGAGHVFDNGKCSRKITSRSAHSTCSPRANRVDIPMPDGL